MRNLRHLFFYVLILSTIAWGIHKLSQQLPFEHAPYLITLILVCFWGLILLRVLRPLCRKKPTYNAWRL